MKILLVIAVNMLSLMCVAQKSGPCAEGAALVHVLRERAFVGSALSRSVWSDSIELAKISNGTYFQACLPAGMHRFRVDDGPGGSREIELVPHLEYFLQVQTVMNAIKSHWDIKRLDKESASSMMAVLSPLSYEKLKAHGYTLAIAYSPRSAQPQIDAGASQAVNPNSSQFYDIKGDQLGMSLEAFKRKYYSFHEGDPAPVCIAGRSEPLLYLTDDEAAAGVISCYPGPASDVSFLLVGTQQSFMRSKVKESTYPGTLPPTMTMANSPLIGLAFHFYKGQLFKIVAVFPADSYPEMKAAFADKFGVPTATPHELQNSYGAKFDAEESNWTNGVSAITMLYRTKDLTQGVMIMRLPSIQTQVEAGSPKKAKDL